MGKIGVLGNSGKRDSSNIGYFKRLITDELEKFFFASTRRRPLILPVVMEI